jgi:asparagine synthase (glutamine-hydrolysing)
VRPRLLERLYPYLQRSPVSQQAISRQFFGHHLEGWREAGFGHDTRWRSTSALRRLFTAEVTGALGNRDVRAELLGRLPAGFERWTPLAQDQYLEVFTLLSGYLLSSQGDRMLMAHSVEGRFPFLDRDVAALADALPPSYKLRVLDEKHVLKRVAADLIPSEVFRRKKQPYRAPDALAFASARGLDWVDAVTSARALEDAGVFVPRSAQQLVAKCRARGEAGQFSNADNMAVVGVLSTQLVFDRFIVRRREGARVQLTTLVDRVSASLGGATVEARG